MITPKPLTVWIATNYGKFLKRCNPGLPFAPIPPARPLLGGGVCLCLCGKALGVPLSFQIRRKVLLHTHCPSPHPQASHFSNSGYTSLPRTLSKPLPTFFPFLTSYSMVKRPLCSCHPPSHPSTFSPHAVSLFFFLPGRKLHQPWSSCPSHLIVSGRVRGG